MNSRHLVDPELQPLLDSMPAMQMSLDLLPAIRAAVIPLTGYDDHTAESTLIRRRIPGPADAPEVEIAIYEPRSRSAALPGILHIHGGGYVAGGTASLESAHRAFAAMLGCMVVSVEYRLAPETSFPGALEDCYAALAWMFAQAAELGVDTARIGVMGESAGGGLAAALALLARDRHEYSLAFQQLIYPMLDDRTAQSPDPHPFAGEFVWTAHSNLFGWTALLGQQPGLAGVSPYAAPARATNLQNLPPAFIATGALDLFVEEDLEYGRRLIRAGVPVEMHVYPGAYHAFDVLTNATVAKAARRDSEAALRRFLAVPTT